ARQGRPAGPALTGRPAPLGAGTDAAPAGDAAALPFGGAAPDPMVDVVVERVLEAGMLHRAVPADLTGDLDADTVAGEEHRGGDRPAVPGVHPGGVAVRLLHGVVTCLSAGG